MEYSWLDYTWLAILLLLLVRVVQMHNYNAELRRHRKAIERYNEMERRKTGC